MTKSGDVIPIDYPLLSLVMITFNQERFIDAAVSAALVQTYPHLEIILSDDCSTDLTYERMQAIVAEYHGPHKVKVRQNASNSGIGEHVNLAVAEASGQFIIIAAGDDISYPDRVQSIFDAWNQGGRSSSCVYSNYNVIDDRGDRLLKTGMEFRPSGTQVDSSANEIHRFFSDEKRHIFGCTAAYSPELFQVFGPIPPDIVHEDEVLALRAILSGGALEVSEPLVDYRLHDSNIYGHSRASAYTTAEQLMDAERRSQRELKTRLTMQGCFIQDLQKAQQLGLISESDSNQLLADCSQQESLLMLQQSFYEASTIRKIVLWIKLAQAGLSSTNLRRMLTRIIPIPLYCRLKATLGRIHRLPKEPLASF